MALGIQVVCNTANMQNSRYQKGEIVGIYEIGIELFVLVLNRCLFDHKDFTKQRRLYIRMDLILKVTK